MQNLPVVMCADRAGIVGNDGETHQGVFDLAFFNLVPNLTIMAPKDFEELKMMLSYAVNLKKPVVIRYPRGGEETNISFEKHEKIEQGKAEILREGKDISIVAIGKMVSKAEEVASILEKQNLSVEVINARFLKPFDEQEILNSIQKNQKVITIEDGITKGGLGSNVMEIIQKNCMEGIKLQMFGYPDEFIKHGSVEEIEKLYGLTAEQIAEKVLQTMPIKTY